MKLSTVIFLSVSICLMLFAAFWPIMKIKWYKTYRPNLIHEAFTPLSKKKRKFIDILFCFFILLPACYVAAYALCSVIENMYYASSSRYWPKVEGTITRSELITYRRDSDTRGISHDAAISYDYIINNQVLNGQRITFREHPFNSSNFKDYSESYVLKYQPGGKVGVYYQPENPNFTVLEPGFEGRSILFVEVPVILFLSSFLLGFLYIFWSLLKNPIGPD